MAEKLSQQAVDALSPAQKAEYAIHHNAVVFTMRAYNADPTAAAKRNWDSAREALDDFVEKTNNPSVAGSPPAQFATQQEVLAYLKAGGYKIEKSALSNHVRTRMLIKKSGAFNRKDVDSYATLHLQSGATGQTQADKKTAELQERKLKAECLRTEEQALKAKIEREAIEGKLIARDDVELELAGRAVALEAGYDHMVYTKAAEWIEICGGDQARADRLINALLEAKNEWLNQYASTADFVVVLKEG